MADRFVDLSQLAASDAHDAQQFDALGGRGAAGSRDIASSSALVGSVNARVSRSATVSPRAAERTERQHAPIAAPSWTSVEALTACVRRARRAVAKLVPLQLAEPVGLG